MPVSYTHLDVYKRQEPFGLNYLQKREKKSVLNMERRWIKTETLPMHSRIRPGRRKMSISVREESRKYLNRSLLIMDSVM